MFEAPFQALPGTSGLRQQAPGPVFAINHPDDAKRSGPGGYKADDPTFKSLVQQRHPATFPTIW
jgi:hypothetical protein